MQYRHEIKHYINMVDYYSIKSRLKLIAAPDLYADHEGKYRVRSIYFDNYENKVLREKLHGLNSREKFRIRFYNCDPSLIKLEKKSKRNSLCMKQAAVLSPEQCLRLLKNDFDWLRFEKEALFIELYAKTKYQLLRPKTVVDYTREAYRYEPGNVRITLDSSLSSGLAATDFLNPSLPTMRVVPSQQVILEVKYDEVLPTVIQDIIQTNVRRSAAISKYTACRLYI